MARSFPWAVAMRLVTAEPKPVRFARGLPVMACARRRGEVAQTCAQSSTAVLKVARIERMDLARPPRSPPPHMAAGRHDMPPMCIIIIKCAHEV